jgi:hypothetical protein
MSCKLCASEQQFDCPAELNFTFPGLKRTNLPAVYVCHRVLICLDCGYAELVIPKQKLGQLKSGMGEPLNGAGHRGKIDASELYGFGSAAHDSNRI